MIKQVIAVMLMGSFLAACGTLKKADVPDYQTPPTQKELELYPPILNPDKVPTPPAQIVTPPQTMEKGDPRQATVKISGPEGLGSGAIISSDGLIVTAAHVADMFRGGKLARIDLPNGKTFQAKVVTIYKKDIAIMKIINVGSQKLPFIPVPDKGGIYVGEEATVWGYSTGALLGKKITFLEQRETWDRASDLEFSTGIRPGDSGGPILNAKGELIGVGVAYINGGPKDGHTIGTNIANIRHAACAADGTYCDGHIESWLNEALSLGHK